MAASPVESDGTGHGRYDGAGKPDPGNDGESGGVADEGHQQTGTSRASSGTHETHLDNAEQLPMESAHYSVSAHKTSRPATGSRVEDSHGEMKPPGFGVVGFVNPEPQAPSSVDPLDLVIAKRKKKELADPVIAEAILTACKLPPPPIPETQNMHEVPEEIQQLMSFGYARQTMTEKDLEFLRNYPLHQKPREPLKVSPVSQISRYDFFRKKYWAQAFHRYPFPDKGEAEDGDKGEQTDYTDDEDLGTTQTIGGGRKEFFPIHIHTDEDWFMESILHVMCILLIVFTLPLSLFFCLKVSSSSRIISDIVITKSFAFNGKIHWNE